MKSKIKEDSVVTKDFPKLMYYDNCRIYFIVLFDTPHTGIVVHTDSDERTLGEYNTFWDSSRFKDFNKTVELSND